MAEFILPAWPAHAAVTAFSTTRKGGCSSAPFHSLNLGTHVGDDANSVASNRALLVAHLPHGSTLQWLTQVHGANVVQAGSDSGEPEADGVWCAEPGYACAIMTADCLPVLFSSRNGDCIAAAHAGWRGLAGGVLEATLLAMPCSVEEVLVWLGPCIGPAAFEVGSQVRDVFLHDTAGDDSAVLAAFEPHPHVADKFYADLHELARLRLRSAGVVNVYAERACTYRDPERFFSYRRDGQTGRMATIIALNTVA